MACRTAISLLALLPAVSGDSPHEHFRSYVGKHGRDYAEGSKEYGQRFALFQQRLEEVKAQNAREDRRWTAGINELSDRTEEELAALRGYRYGAKSSFAAPGGLGLAAVSTREVDLAALPADFTWKERLAAMREVMNQGSCGSCWAVSSATVLRAHSELFQTDRQFSIQQLVDCTPNPQHCGGTGGCAGATAELAMEYAAKRGLVSETDLAYQAKQEDCPARMKLAGPMTSSFLSIHGAGAAATVRSGEDGSFTVEGGGGAKFGLVGWRKLPENKAEPLMDALVREGPVVVSVGANSKWSMYSSGVMDACEKGAVINHAVVLTGFGKDGGSNYWQIQNSWGPSWGEQGFIRILRREAKEENAYCGWDKRPEEGTACTGGPSKVWVCGECGMLYDSVVPTFTLSAEGWWHKQGNRSVAAAA